jgi:type IV pilus assembly protein PilM
VFFSRNKTLVGLDIGSSSIKVVELKDLGKGKGFHLVNASVEPLSPEAIVDGAIMDSGLVVDAIQRGFAARNIKSSDCAIALSGHSVIIKRISLPVMTEEELAESIQWEAEQYIPFDVEDVNIAYQILKGTNLAGDGNMDVLLVAAKKDKINDYTAVVGQAGKNAALVDVDVFALQNAYEMNYEIDSGQTCALANIGATVTNVSVLRGSSSIFWRDISIGGSQYNDAIRKELNLSFEQSEILKRGEEVEGVPVENVTPILATVNDYVGAELQKTLDFFKNTTPGETIDKIYISGGSSRVPNLLESLGERFGIPVERLDPFRRVTMGKDIPEETTQELSASAAVAVGLASRKVGDR